MQPNVHISIYVAVCVHTEHLCLFWEGAALRSMCLFSYVSVSVGDIFSCLLFLCAHTSMGAHICREELLLQFHWYGFQSLLIAECCSGLGGLESGDREGRKGAQRSCIAQNRLREMNKAGRKPDLRK